MEAITFQAKGINVKEKVFKKTLTLAAIVVVVILVAIFFTLLINSMPSIKAFGARFFYDKTWDPVADEFGAPAFL